MGDEIRKEDARDVVGALHLFGFAAVIAKPIQFEELIATVDRHLGACAQ